MFTGTQVKHKEMKLDAFAQFLHFPTTLLTLTSYYCVWIQRPVLKPASKGAQISNRHNCLALKLDKQTNKTPKQTQPINISLTNFNRPKKGYIKK